MKVQLNKIISPIPSSIKRKGLGEVGRAIIATTVTITVMTGWLFYLMLPVKSPTEYSHKKQVILENHPSQIGDSNERSYIAGRDGSVKEATVTSQPVNNTIQILLFELEKAPELEVGIILKQRLAELMIRGDEGVKLISEFLQAGEDIILENQHLVVEGGSLKSYPSVRAAMIDCLGEMKTSSSIATLNQVFGTTTDPFELLLSARSLEKLSPGVYRHQILESIPLILTALNDSDPGKWKDDDRYMAQWSLEFATHYQAVEMLPVIQDFSKKDRWLQGFFFREMLPEFPGAVQAQLLTNFLKDKNSIDERFPWDQLDFRSHELRYLVFNHLENLDEFGKIQLIGQLQNINLSDKKVYHFINFSDVADTDKWKVQIAGVLQFFAEIEPQFSTPLLMRRLEDAKQILLRQIESYPVVRK